MIMGLMFWIKKLVMFKLNAASQSNIQIQKYSFLSEKSTADH